MSRYIVQERVERQLVAGYDRPLRQVFGQAYGPVRGGHRTGPIAGFPARYGLGIKPPLSSLDAVRTAVDRLSTWLREQGAEEADIARVAADVISDCEYDLS